jgi:hypothetical protein
MTTITRRESIASLAVAALSTMRGVPAPGGLAQSQSARLRRFGTLVAEWEAAAAGQ